MMRHAHATCTTWSVGGPVQPSTGIYCLGDPLSWGYVASLDSSLCWGHCSEPRVHMGGKGALVQWAFFREGGGSCRPMTIFYPVPTLPHPISTPSSPQIDWSLELGIWTPLS